MKSFLSAAVSSLVLFSASSAWSEAVQTAMNTGTPRQEGSALTRRPASTESRPEEKKAEKKAEKKTPPAPAPAEPTHDVEIWLGERIGRFGDYEFAVLGGRPDHPTPTGAFHIEWKSRSWWSRQWDAAMPYACFFHRGAAIHEGSLRVKSHGCIHVSREAAKRIFSKGKEKVTRVIVYP